jgi:hypothetical protein
MASTALRLPGLGTLRNLALFGALPAALLVFWHLASANGWIRRPCDVSADRRSAVARDRDVFADHVSVK